jgi:hypothetical protein
MDRSKTKSQSTSQTINDNQGNTDEKSNSRRLLFWLGIQTSILYGQAALTTRGTPTPPHTFDPFCRQSYGNNL